MHALDGLKVLDLSRILAGPWCSQLLADLGAEVIKVERPKVGDDTRKWGSYRLKTIESSFDGDSAYFLAANRGKKSICVDFKTQDGQEIIKRLASKCDIIAV